MENIRLKVLNGTAKLIAWQRNIDQPDIDMLVEGVMDYLLGSGCNLIDQENLHVRISFDQAEVFTFFIDNGAGRIIDLKKHTTAFKKRLSKNRTAGLKRLIPVIVEETHVEKDLPKIVFGKN